MPNEYCLDTDYFIRLCVRELTLTSSGPGHGLLTLRMRQTCRLLQLG